MQKLLHPLIISSCTRCANSAEACREQNVWEWVEFRAAVIHWLMESFLRFVKRPRLAGTAFVEFQVQPSLELSLARQTINIRRRFCKKSANNDNSTRKDLGNRMILISSRL